MGRIRILEDKDGDGFYETSTVWADNLLFANGLLLWKDGAIVTMAPKITHLRDTEAPARRIRKKSYTTGFAAQNPQLRVSHPILGLDSWIVLSPTACAAARRRAGEPKGNGQSTLRGMDFRFDPVHLDQYEADHRTRASSATPSTNGAAASSATTAIISATSSWTPLSSTQPLPRRPRPRRGYFGHSKTALLNSGGKVYPISKNWTTSSLHEGRFTAACGVFIYHGQLLPRRPSRNCAFTCEPTGNLVHMEILTPKGATFNRQAAQARGRIPRQHRRLVPPRLPDARPRSAVRRRYVSGGDRASRFHAAGAEESPRPVGSARTRAASGASCRRTTRQKRHGPTCRVCRSRSW